jgi:hypothetical protein
VRLIRVSLVGAALAFAALGTTSGSVLAYGKADHPLAQVELSANCVNRNSPLCAPDKFGLGGIWLWIEVDQGGTADVAGAGCGHVPGVGGEAGSIRGEFPWVPFQGSLGDLATAFPDVIAVGADSGGSYYVFPEFGFAFPVTTGHYALHLDKGVFLQSQVAP